MIAANLSLKDFTTEEILFVVRLGPFGVLADGTRYACTQVSIPFEGGITKILLRPIESSVPFEPGTLVSGSRILVDLFSYQLSAEAGIVLGRRLTIGLVTIL